MIGVKGLIVDNFAGGGGASTGIETAQVAKCGNSVCPPLAEALVRANAPSCAQVAAGDSADERAA